MNEINSFIIPRNLYTYCRERERGRRDKSMGRGERFLDGTINFFLNHININNTFFHNAYTFVVNING